MKYLDYYFTIGILNKTESRRLEVGQISNAFKSFTKKYNIPIFCLAQLSRAVESTQSKKPNMGHLKEAGEIEQDADKIIFPHRERDGQNKDLCKVLKRKVRDGEVGHKTLGFQFGNLYETEQEWQDEKPEGIKGRKPYGQ